MPIPGSTTGGRPPEWSNVVLERILGEHATGVECVGLIDWHTGIGEYGKPFFLCFKRSAVSGVLAGGDVGGVPIAWLTSARTA